MDNFEKQKQKKLKKQKKKSILEKRKKKETKAKKKKKNMWGKSPCVLELVIILTINLEKRLLNLIYRKGQEI
jgi:hypothetical protein